jgi:hypothetical protein
VRPDDSETPGERRRSDDDRVAGVENRSADQVESVHGSIGHEHLVGSTLYSAATGPLGDDPRYVLRRFAAAVLEGLVRLGLEQ